MGCMACFFFSFDIASEDVGDQCTLTLYFRLGLSLSTIPTFQSVATLSRYNHRSLSITTIFLVEAIFYPGRPITSPVSTVQEPKTISQAVRRTHRRTLRILNARK